MDLDILFGHTFHVLLLLNGRRILFFSFESKRWTKRLKSTATKKKEMERKKQIHEEHNNKCTSLRVFFGYEVKPKEIKLREKIIQAKRWELDFFFHFLLLLRFTCLFHVFFWLTNWTLWNEFSFFFFFFLVVVCFLTLLLVWSSCVRCTWCEKECLVQINCCRTHFHL